MDITASSIGKSKSISNLVRAIEQGISNETTKSRMDGLEEQKDEIEVALAEAHLKENLGHNKERILHFLYQFADTGYTDINAEAINQDPLKLSFCIWR